MRSTVLLPLVFLFIVGCNGRASSRALVRSYGWSESPDGGKKLEVTRREKSLVDFQVFDSASGKLLASDCLGSDAMRWFLYWEDSKRLWGYGSDVGYFKVFEFNADGSVAEATVASTTVVPEVVWRNLPSSLQQTQKVRHAAP